MEVQNRIEMPLANTADQSEKRFPPPQHQNIVDRRFSPEHIRIGLFHQGGDMRVGISGAQPFKDGERENDISKRRHPDDEDPMHERVL